MKIDFFFVEEHQMPIHARLENWRRWNFNRISSGTSPMFRLYRPEDQEDRDDLSKNSIPVDHDDATLIQVAIKGLPEVQRHALNWNYLAPSNPRKMAERLGLTIEGLVLLVRAARNTLIESGA